MFESGQGCNTAEISCAHVNDTAQVELESRGIEGRISVGLGSTSTFVSCHRSLECDCTAAGQQPECDHALSSASSLGSSDHVRPQPRAAQEGAPRDGRTSPNHLDQGGAQASPPRAHRGGHEQNQPPAGTCGGVKVPVLVQEAEEGHGKAQGRPMQLCGDRREPTGD